MRVLEFTFSAKVIQRIPLILWSYFVSGASLIASVFMFMGGDFSLSMVLAIWGFFSFLVGFVCSRELRVAAQSLFQNEFSIVNKNDVV